MKILKGKGVFKGVSIGRIACYGKEKSQIKRIKINDAESELNRFENARIKAINELKGLYDRALIEVGEVNATIFEVHQMMLDDLDYIESVQNIIKSQMVNAEFAVAKTSDNFSEMFASMDDDYMRERASDVKDISERVINILIGNDSQKTENDEPSIIFAVDLAPSETVQLDKSKVLGFVTMKGSSNSHTSILARTMNIAAVIGVGNIDMSDLDGKMAIVDGINGEVYIEPDDETMERMQKIKKECDDKNALLKELYGKENITKDGQKVMLYANIGSLADIGFAVKNDAGGIGLFRSEFLYLEAKDYPTENEQFEIYRQAAENMAGKRIIIRTLDIGADKKIDYFNLPEEENPAMGYRAIRICLDRVDIFKTQLRALYRASAYGNIAIMFPMIISLEEVLRIKEIVEEVKGELRNEGFAFNENTELGIMIETPAAVMISDILAKEVDFFSIGTNDLTQYSLAVDRQNRLLENSFDPHHKAILRMIKMACDNAHKEGIWIGICGELGADLSLTETFLSMGIDELSVSPGAILGLRQKIRDTDISKIKDKILSSI